jgi:hypothetical protein
VVIHVVGEVGLDRGPQGQRVEHLERAVPQLPGKEIVVHGVVVELEQSVHLARDHDDAEEIDPG